MTMVGLVFMRMLVVEYLSYEVLRNIFSLGVQIPPYFLKQMEESLRFSVHEIYKLNFDWQFDTMEFESEKKKIRHSLQEQIKT